MCSTLNNNNNNNNGINWKYIWKNYCLNFNNTKLTDNNLSLRDYGIKNKSELNFCKIFFK
jgi:hypothetical protein